MKNKFNRIKGIAFALAVVALSVGSSFAEPPAGPDVSGIVTSAGALLTSIYPIVLAAVSFGILISLVKMVRRK